MSTSLFVDAPVPPALREVLEAIDRDGDLALADGEIAALGAWPESGLFYRRGRSSRGVHVGFDGARFAIRLLVLSSPDDYELAFRFAEVLGGERDVLVEPGDRVAARDLRAKLAGDWMVRDMAVGVTAIRSSLATGGTVRIEGPVRALEISPEALDTTDALGMIEVLRRAQMEANAPSPPRAIDPDDALDEAHLEALRREEDALPPLPRARRGWTIFAAVMFLVLGPPALIVRIVTWPLRGWLRDRAGARHERRRVKHRAQLAEARAKLEARPDDLARRVDDAVLTYAEGKTAKADRALSAIVREHDHAIAWHNLAVTRDRLRLPRLSKAAAARAKQLGHVAKHRSRIARVASMIGQMFVAFAGLAPD
jgi:hypothetical protein